MSAPSKREIEEGKNYLGAAKRCFERGGDYDTSKQVEKIEKEVETKLDPQKG